MNPLVSCFVKLGSNKRITCGEKLSNSNCGSPVISDVIYKATIKNIGQDCLLINKATMTLGESTKYTININSWNQAKKSFCPGESMPLTKRVSSVDLCEYEGSKVDVKVALNQGGENRSALGYMTFPNANTVSVPTTVPTAVATPAPTPAPVPQIR